MDVFGTFFIYQLCAVGSLMYRRMAGIIKTLPRVE